MLIRYFSFFIFIFYSSFAFSLPSKDEAKLLNSTVFKLDYFDYVYGNSSAPIEVFEYYALTCPHCGNFYSYVFPQIKKEYIDTGKVRWIKRSYALDPASRAGTMLLYCAEKEQYEKYLGILLGKQESWAYQKDFTAVLKNIANLGGISSQKFDECMENRAFKTEIAKTADEGKRILNISGTPAFFINREKITAYNYKSFKEHFDKILQEKNQTKQP